MPIDNHDQNGFPSPGLKSINGNKKWANKEYSTYSRRKTGTTQRKFSKHFIISITSIGI